MITRWWSVDERREGHSTNISSIRSPLSTGQKLRILHKSQYLHKISLMLYFMCNEEQLLSGWRGDVLTVLISDQGGVSAIIITHLDNISTTTTWEKTRIWWGRINCSYNMVPANQPSSNGYFSSLLYRQKRSSSWNIHSGFWEFFWDKLSFMR